MKTDRMLAWVGLAIGLLGLIPLFRDSNHQLQAAYLGILALLILIFVVLYRSGRGPQYSTLAMKKTLEILDANGALATLRREQTIRVNFGSLSEIWCRDIVADGSIQNFLIDGDPPHRQESMACLVSICKRFNTPIFKGQQVVIVWSYDLLNAFPATHEALEHDVTLATRSLELNVILPRTRPCRGASLYESVSGEPAQPLGKPSIQAHATLLKATVTRPKDGHTICLTWEW